MTRRGLIIGVIVVVIVIVGLLAWQKSREPFVPRDFNEVVAELKDPKKIERYTEQLVEAYKNDTYGGDTPEETLNLFIAALKAGDTDLAAKYFLLEKQAQMAEELKVGKEKGNLDFLLGYLEKVNPGRPTGAGERYTFTMAEKGVAVMSFDLILNPYSNKWKIESL